MTNLEHIENILKKLDILRKLDPEMKLFGAGLIGYKTKNKNLVSLVINREKPKELEYNPNTQSWGHRYSLHPKLTEEEILKFEFLLKTKLPDEYRDFLKYVGNGGAGPDYGLFPVQQTLEKEKEFLHTDHFLQPFPLEEKWNAYEKNSYKCIEDEMINGSIIISHAGCSLYARLVISGPQKGTMWSYSYMGLFPFNQTFFEWYNSWLDQSIKLMEKSQWFDSLPTRKSKGPRDYPYVFIKGIIINETESEITIQIDGTEEVNFEKYLIEIVEDGIWIDQYWAKKPWGLP